MKEEELWTVGGESGRRERKSIIVRLSSAEFVASILLIVITTQYQELNQENNDRDKKPRDRLSVVGSSVGDGERSQIGSVLSSNGSSSLLSSDELGDLKDER